MNILINKYNFVHHKRPVKYYAVKRKKIQVLYSASTISLNTIICCKRIFNCVGISVCAYTVFYAYIGTA